MDKQEQQDFLDELWIELESHVDLSDAPTKQTRPSYHMRKGSDEWYAYMNKPKAYTQLSFFNE